MENNALALAAALVALLVGLAAGKAWERYKLQDGRWIDRRRLRDSPHFILGLNFLVANQTDQAIDALSRAAALHPESLELRLILGNLYREKGQVGRAIQEHQSLLQRPNLRRLEHANVLLCLGLDYRRGGFVDRAVEAFNEVLRLDPENQYALVHLEKLHAEQKQWAQAHAFRERLRQSAAPEDKARSQATLAFIENELGREALDRGDRAEAARRFEAAIELDPAALPAYLNLGDARLAEGRLADAIALWEKLIHVAPDRAYLAFDRLAGAYAQLGTPEKYSELCRRLIEASPQDWRARLALARYVGDRGQPMEAVGLLLDALVHNPHALVLHQAIWRRLSAMDLPRGLVARYMDLAEEAVFYLDPHICIRCRYRSTELLWQCPQCHEWNTFLEERIAPAKDDEEAPAELIH
jgi:lipopolysaccharide biosynthesis regulator YciM